MKLLCFVLFLAFLFDFVYLFKFLIPATPQWVVIAGGITVDIEDFPEPLQKLKIVLVLALDEFLDVDVFHDAELGEGLL